MDDGLAGVGFTDRDVAALDALVNHHVEAEALSDDEFDQMVSGNPVAGTGLLIEGLSADEIDRFRAVPGDSDADRFRSLLRLA